MAAIVAANAPGLAEQGQSEVPLWRLWVLRSTYAIFVVPAIVMIPFLDGPLPKLILHGPIERGMINGIQVGLFVMCAIGLRYPLRMLPILLFETAWKTIWLVFYGAPQWLAGVGAPTMSLDLILIGGAPILGGLVIPWGYVWRHYLRAPGDRWR